MKVLIAPSAYKGTFSPLIVAQAIALGLRQVVPQLELVLFPLADGGDGTIDVLNFYLPGNLQSCLVAGPLNEPVEAKWLKLGQRAIVELASASGIRLVDNKLLAPLKAHTKGLGELLLHCLGTNVREIIIGLGGSASTDGGSGALVALGARLLDSRGQELPSGGGCLAELAKIDLDNLDQRMFNVKLQLACDVQSPLLGINGAAAIFAPQKGASPQEVQLLENGLTRWADLLENEGGQSYREKSGAGAAGGVAFGLMSVFSATLVSGFTLIAQLVGLERQLNDCDIVITGEGRLDLSSFMGKATGELLKACERLNKPLYIISASAPCLDWRSKGIAHLIAASPADGLASTSDITKAAARVAEKLA